MGVQWTADFLAETIRFVTPALSHYLLARSVKARFPMLRTLILGSAFAVFAVSPGLAETATLLGVFKNWETYTQGSGNEMSCFALSKPRAQQPRNAKRAALGLMVTDWPGRKVKAEPQIVPGYAYKAGVPVYLEIGSDKFMFFPRNEGANGAAWLKDLSDGVALLNALNQGVSAVAFGTSARGTRTVDTYSLAGFPEAMAKIHAACNMG